MLRHAARFAPAAPVEEPAPESWAFPRKRDETCRTRFWGQNMSEPKVFVREEVQRTVAQVLHEVSQSGFNLSESLSWRRIGIACIQDPTLANNPSHDILSR